MVSLLDFNKSGGGRTSLCIHIFELRIVASPPTILKSKKLSALAFNNMNYYFDNQMIKM